jgi:hypothetical protein
VVKLAAGRRRGTKVVKALSLALFWLAMLGAAAFGTWAVWRELDGIEMEAAGWIALGLGAFFSLAVGGGLMALVFHSSRKGHDARAHGATQDPGSATAERRDRDPD